MGAMGPALVNYSREMGRSYYELAIAFRDVGQEDLAQVYAREACVWADAADSTENLMEEQSARPWWKRILA